MAHLFHKAITRYVDGRGKRCPNDAPAAQRVDEKSTKWYGRYRSPDGIVREVPLFTDKAASRQRLAELERKAEHAATGLIDPFADQRQRAISEHLDDFRQHLAAKGNSEQHVDLTVARCEAAFTGCGFKLLGQLDADKAANWLRQRRDEGQFGIATSNHHLAAVKSFGNWLVKSRRLERTPFAHLTRLNAKVDVRVERCALEPEELSRLIEATGLSPRTYRGLSGPDRVALYTLATLTGLRANELASLTIAAFDFAADPPTVSVKAANEKAKRGATLPLHPFAVEGLTAWMRSKQQVRKAQSPTQSLWPGTWPEKAAEMLRRDMAEARDHWIKEGQSDPTECERRTSSLFLLPENSQGEVADFHALRHTFITLLASSGVHPKVAQQLARHSTITLTMDRYSHTRLVDLNAAVENLPALTLPKRLSQASEANTNGPASTADSKNPSVSEFRVALAPEKKLATEQANQPSSSLEIHNIPTPPPLFRVARRVALVGDETGSSVISTDETIPLTQPTDCTTQLPDGRGVACVCEPLITHEENAPGWIRTTDRRIRNPLLYPTELRARVRLLHGVWRTLGIGWELVKADQQVM